MATNYKKGDLVWAKMKGYPFWPGRIAKPLKEMKKPSKSNMQCVYFFGTKNYSYIELNNLKDYNSHKLQFENATKSHSFRSALDDLEKTLKGEYDSIDDHEEEEDDDGPFDLQVGATSTPKNVKKTKTVDQSKKRTSFCENVEKKVGQSKKRTSFCENVEKKVDQSKKRTSFCENVEKKVDQSKKRTSFCENVEKKVGQSKKRTSFCNPINKKRASAGEDDEKNLSNKLTPKKEEESNLDMGTKYKKRKTDKLTNSSLTYNKNGTRQSYISPQSYNSRKMSRRKLHSEPVDLINISEGLSAKRIKPSQLTIGFIGLGPMGSRLLKNLLHSKHKVTIWNRTEQKCQNFEEIGARVASTTYDLVKNADIIFLCVENENAVVDILFATALTYGIENGSKTFVNLTPVSAEVSEHISDILHAYNCKYLSVNFLGTHENAKNAQLKALVAGDNSVIEEAQSCFDALFDYVYNVGNDFKKLYRMNFIIYTYVSRLNRVLMESIINIKKTGESLSLIRSLSFISPLLSNGFHQVSLEHYQKFGVPLDIAPPIEILRGPKNIDMIEESKNISASLFHKQCECNY